MWQVAAPRHPASTRIRGAQFVEAPLPMQLVLLGRSSPRPKCKPARRGVLVCVKGNVEMKDRDTEYRELIEELTRLEEEAPVLDLRDPAGWDRYQQQLSDLRERIAAFK